VEKRDEREEERKEGRGVPLSPILATPLPLCLRSQYCASSFVQKKTPTLVIVYIYVKNVQICTEFSGKFYDFRF